MLSGPKPFRAEHSGVGSAHWESSDRAWSIRGHWEFSLKLRALKPGGLTAPTPQLHLRLKRNDIRNPWSGDLPSALVAVTADAGGQQNEDDGHQNPEPEIDVAKDAGEIQVVEDL